MSQLIELTEVPEDNLKPLISQASRENYVIKYIETKHPELKGYPSKPHHHKTKVKNR